MMKKWYQKIRQNSKYKNLKKNVLWVIIYGQFFFKLPLFLCEKIMQYIFFYFQSTIEQQAHIIRWSMYFSYSKLTQTERNSLANL